MPSTENPANEFGANAINRRANTMALSGRKRGPETKLHATVFGKALIARPQDLLALHRAAHGG